MSANFPNKLKSNPNIMQPKEDLYSWDGDSDSPILWTLQGKTQEIKSQLFDGSEKPKHYYLVIHDTHKLLLWGSEVGWNLGLISFESCKVFAFTLFACLSSDCQFHLCLKQNTWKQKQFCFTFFFFCRKRVMRWFQASVSSSSKRSSGLVLPRLF